MNIKRLTCASAVAAAIAVSSLTVGAGAATAQPGSDPCGFGNCQGPRDGDRGGPPPGYRDGPPPGDRGDRWGGRDDGPGRWDGRPPPDLAWRGIDQGRYDHQPFNYNGAWVNPIFNPDYNNWGFWFFGAWIPL